VYNGAQMASRLERILDVLSEHPGLTAVQVETALAGVPPSVAGAVEECLRAMGEGVRNHGGEVVVDLKMGKWVGEVTLVVMPNNRSLKEYRKINLEQGGPGRGDPYQEQEKEWARLGKVVVNGAVPAENLKASLIRQLAAVERAKG